jgi:hypothetical protein
MLAKLNYQADVNNIFQSQNPYLSNMQMSAHLKQKLEALGLNVWEANQRCLVYKTIGRPGNRLPRTLSSNFINVETHETTTIQTDCLMIQFWPSPNKYELICWNWVPGPGPGDFDLAFPTEEEAITFIISYYCGQNDYFEARKKYEEDKLA